LLFEKRFFFSKLTFKTTLLITLLPKKSNKSLTVSYTDLRAHETVLDLAQIN